MATVHVLAVDVLADAKAVSGVRYSDGKYDVVEGGVTVETVETYDEALDTAVAYAEAIEAAPVDEVTKRELLDQIANLQATVALQDEQIAARESQIVELSDALTSLPVAVPVSVKP